MQGDKRVDELMLPVLNAINRHVKDRDAKTEIYNRAYEALLISMDVKDMEISNLSSEVSALREQVANLKMSKTHKARVQAVKHMLEQTSFIRKCFSLDVFRNYPRLRDEGLKILDGELDNEEMI